MTDRFKELAEQAGYTKDMFGVGHWDMPECKKFARLIVQDNIQTLRGNGYDDAAQVLQDIHFGIEDPV